MVNFAVAFEAKVVNHTGLSAWPANATKSESISAAIVDHSKIRKNVLALALLTLALGACATPPTDPAARAQFDANNDPFEPMNRSIFAFDMFLDKWFVRPAAQTYRTVIPDFGREAIRNFLGNLHEP